MFLQLYYRFVCVGVQYTAFRAIKRFLLCSWKQQTKSKSNIHTMSIHEFECTYVMIVYRILQSAQSTHTRAASMQPKKGSLISTRTYMKHSSQCNREWERRREEDNKPYVYVMSQSNIYSLYPIQFLHWTSSFSLVFSFLAWMPFAAYVCVCVTFCSYNIIINPIRSIYRSIQFVYEWVSMCKNRHRRDKQKKEHQQIPPQWLLKC